MSILRPGAARRLSVLGTVAALAAAAGCASLPTARMALPAPLADRAAERFDGMRHGREGTVRVGGQAFRYERGADRLTVLERVDRDQLSLRLGFTDGDARCDGRRLEGRVGIVGGALRPLELNCRFGGRSPGRLQLRELRGAAAGTRDAREGEAEFGGVRLALRSVHELQGTPLPLAAPAGYLLLRDGRPVAALELTDAVPSLRRAPDLDAATTQAVLQSAVVLGLIFDPAARPD